MKYVQPYGITDPDAPYINGDPSIGRQGSIPPAAAFEHPMREIVNVISKNLLTPTDTDLSQMLKATRSQRANFAEDTGSVNTLSVAFDPPLGSYSLGLPLRVRVHDTCTGPSTIDAGAGRVPIRRTDGLALAAGDLAAGGIAGLVWDGAAFQLINFFGRGGGGGGGGDTIINNYNVNLPYTVDSSTTPNVVTAVFSPAITTLVAGTTFLVKIANTNTADTVINVNAFTNKPVRANGAGKLLPGDLTAGDIKMFIFDGTNFYVDPNPQISNNVTVNIPSTQFPDPQSTLTQFSRKTIAQNAMLTFQLAAGVYSPIIIIHKDASRITIKGTMIGATPVATNFAQTGSSASARAADAANNIVMLRSRYGSEIRITTDGGIGFSNFGPGDPTIQDMLITHDRTKTNVAGIATDWSQPLNTTNLAINVAIWGCTWAYYCGGMQRVSGGSANNCFQGPTAINGAHIHISSGFISCGNDYVGMYSANGSVLVLQAGVQSNVNGQFGALCSGESYILIQGTPGVSADRCNLTGNGLWDCYCADTSEIMMYGTTANTLSPPLGTIGNFNGLIRSTG